MSFWCHRFDQNSNKNILRVSALKFFCSFLGLRESFLGLFGDLVSNIINTGAYRKPQKASRKLQKVSGHIFVAILVESMTTKSHFETNWPLASCLLRSFGILKNGSLIAKRLVHVLLSRFYPNFILILP